MSDANRTQMLNSDPNRTVMSGAPVLDPNKTMMGNAPTINATVTIKPIQCPVCKTFNPGGVKFCVECDSFLTEHCPPTHLEPQRFNYLSFSNQRGESIPSEQEAPSSAAKPTS
jgi:hypothetical protein